MKRALLVLGLLPSLSLAAPDSLYSKSFNVPDSFCETYPATACYSIDYSLYDQFGILTVTTRRGIFFGAAMQKIKPFDLYNDGAIIMNRAIRELNKNVFNDDPSMRLVGRRHFFAPKTIRWDDVTESPR
jgi:hypothetical protein